MNRPRRAALYLPASNPRAIAKARTLSADVVILDLEDAVAPEAKGDARAAAVAAIRDGGFVARELVLRVNALDTDWGADDLAASVAAKPDAILVPKISSAADVAAYVERAGGVSVWAMVETAGAVLRLDAIAAVPGLAALVMGTNDLAKDLRMRPGADRAPMHGFLAATVAAARAHGRVALDGVWNAIDDADGLAAECAQAVAFGFDGKTLIHPGQIDACLAAFRPSAAEIEAAQAIVAAFAAPEAAGKGAIRHAGAMVERLHLAEAEALLARGRRVNDLPIQAVLPDLLAVLRDRSNAVLVAPPGAGKTTAVAPALLTEPWCTGEILLLSPRRLAARAAAERMAATAGEPVGRTIGYATRLDSKRSAATRITVVTEGIFVARIQADPELAGISAVLFDEVHERSLDGDFGLALALDAQAALRPDLRLVAMSATLDGSRFAALMGDAPVIESEGRSHPLTLVHVGRGGGRIEDDMAAAIRRALVEREGGLLAFLPGVAEIERTAERLTLPEDMVLHRLHGSLDPAAQRAAIAPEALRKVVLATSIAETSLTLAGIRIVVDSGLARRPRYDRAAGMTRLVTERASQAAVVQRAGRAARQGPGVAYRLWEEAATAGLPRFDPPEILEADLSGLVLDAALWGVGDPRDLAWLDPPPAAAVAEARARLAVLGAIDGDGRPTVHGRAIARLPMPPRIAHMLVRAGEMGLARVAAEVAVLLGERGLGGTDVDLESRVRRWRSERGAKAEAARGLAARWALLAGGKDGASSPPARGRGEIATAIALAFPDRLARRRDGTGEAWASVGGRGFRLDPASALASAGWLAVADISGSASGARILGATAIDEESVETLFADRIETLRTLAFDPATGAVEARRERRLGAVRLSSGPDPTADRAAMATALVEGVRAHGLALLPWDEGAATLRTRAAFAGVALDDAALLDRLDDWLPPIVAGKRRLSAIPAGALAEALRGLIGWDALRRIDRLAPADFASPAGSRHAIDYGAEGGPRVELRVQALFGLATHPVVGEARTPLVLSLTSPAGRPIQTTRDLPGFWAGSWAAVAKEMRGRYPRHPWPDDPASASATLRTKNADARARGSG